MDPSPINNQDDPDRPEEVLTEEELQQIAWDSLSQAEGFVLIGLDEDRHVVFWAGAAVEIFGCEDE